jgi:hypothetical protein
MADSHDTPGALTLVAIDTAKGLPRDTGLSYRQLQQDDGASVWPTASRITNT